MTPGINITGGVTSEASNMECCEDQWSWAESGGEALSSLIKMFSSKEHLDWFKKDLNGAKIITA